MKKIFALALVAVLACVAMVALVGCQKTEVESVTIYAPDGAPSLAIAKIVSDGKIGDTTATTVITTGEDVVAKAMSKQADIAVLPTNAAAKVYNVTGGEYLMLSVNVFGVLYVVGTEQLTDIAQLNGKTIQSIGLGNTPEYVFKRVLSHKGLTVGQDGVDIVYQTDATAIIPQFLAGKANFAVLGEPAVTNLIQKASTKGITVYNLFDLQQLWSEAIGTDTVGYPQACIIVKKDLLSDKPFVSALDKALSANSPFLTENASTLTALMTEHGSTLTVNYTADLLARCNVNYIRANTLKQDIETYLKEFGFVENSSKPANNLPDGAFYFE